MPALDTERLLTLTDAAELLNVKPWQIRRAAKRGDIPTYRPFNSRAFVRLSEVVAFIDASRSGGVR